MPDRDLPATRPDQFVRAAWYCVSWSEDLDDEPKAIRVLERPLVLYRTEAGAPVALRDICSHKFAPLHMGKRVNGDRIQCPYHGLEFGPDGRCLHNPHGRGSTPRSLDALGYQAVERHGAIWVWMDPKRPGDPATIPDFRHLTEKDRRTVRGRGRIDANYLLIADNLMDLSHAFYVHGIPVTKYANMTRSVADEGAGITDYRLYSGVTPSAVLRSGVEDPDLPGDFWADIRWYPTSCFRVHGGVSPLGEGRESSRAVDQFGSHLLTPETATTTHYFFANSRNFCLGDSKIDDIFRAWQQRALMREDPEILEAVGRMESDALRDGMRPALLDIDESGVRVHRAIARLLESAA